MIVKFIDGVFELWFVLAIGLLIGGLSCIFVFIDTEPIYSLPNEVSEEQFEDEYKKQMIYLIEHESDQSSVGSLKKKARSMVMVQLGSEKIKRYKNNIHFKLIPAYIFGGFVLFTCFISAFDVYSDWDRKYQRRKEKKREEKSRREEEKHQLEMKHKQEEHEARIKLLDPCYDPVENNRNRKL